MSLTPWMILTVLVAGMNWAALLVVRARWGWTTLALAVAALVGCAAGNAIGGRTGLELVRIGEFHLLAACVGAQLAMLATLLLSGIAPGRGG